MRDTGDDEPTVVADPGDSLAAAEDDRQFTRTIADFHFDGRYAGPRFDAHASDLAANGDTFPHRHIGERDEMEIAELRTQALGGEFLPRLHATREETLESHRAFQRTLNDVSTRKLIITSLICGVLILVAGTVKLLQTANDDATTLNLLGVGAETTIGDLRIAVNEVEVTAIRTLVTVTMRGLAGDDPIDGWSMLANGAVTKPMGSRDCPSVTDVTTCTLEFVAAIGTPTIVFARDGETRQWLGS